LKDDDSCSAVSRDIDDGYEQDEEEQATTNYEEFEKKGGENDV